MSEIVHVELLPEHPAHGDREAARQAVEPAHPGDAGIDLVNASGDPREQLAQQLLAFIFNVRHRLDAPAAAIELPDGTFVSAQSLIDDALAAWTSGTAEEQGELQSLLDWFNNNDAVSFVHHDPC